MSTTYYPYTRDTTVTDNIATATTVLANVVPLTTNGGTIKLEIDRYGHLTLIVVINPPPKGS